MQDVNLLGHLLPQTLLLQQLSLFLLLSLVFYFPLTLSHLENLLEVLLLLVGEQPEDRVPELLVDLKQLVEHILNVQQLIFLVNLRVVKFSIDFAIVL